MRLLCVRRTTVPAQCPGLPPPRKSAAVRCSFASLLPRRSVWSVVGRAPVFVVAWPRSVARAAPVCAAGGVDLEVALRTIVAGGEGLALGQLRQQRLFLELALVELRQRLARAHDEVDEEAAEAEDGDEQCRGDLEHGVLRAGAHITPCPEDQGDPKDHNKGGEEEDDDEEETREAAERA